MIPRRKKKLFCSFCRRSDADVQKLVGGPGVHICDGCIDKCVLVVAGRPAPAFGGWDTLSSDTLLAALGPSEAGVEAAREVLQNQIDILRKREVSWSQIGEALGISRQAAWERFS